MLMCTKRGGCQKLDGHGGRCGRWSRERGEYIPLDAPREHPAPEPTRQAMVLEFADGHREHSPHVELHTNPDGTISVTPIEPFHRITQENPA